MLEGHILIMNSLERWQLYTQTVRAHLYTHTLIYVCLPWLPSLQCNDDWVSPLDWLHSCSAIPLSTVRNHLVSLGLLQSNWPFKEGIHHVKQCNWDWYSRCSIPHFVLHPSTLTHFSPFSAFTSCSPPLFPASCSQRVSAFQHRVPVAPVFGWLSLTSECSAL